MEVEAQMSFDMMTLTTPAYADRSQLRRRLLIFIGGRPG
jgi:hypothetical protein